MNFASAWLLTVVLHGAVLLTFAFVVDRALPRLLPAARELLWRGALFGALLTATVQLAVQHAPLGGRVMFAAPNLQAPAADAAAGSARSSVATAANPVVPDNAAASAPAASTPKPAATQAPPASLSVLLARALVAQPSDPPAPRAPFPWTLALWVIWAIGAQFGVFRFALAWTRWQRRVRAAKPLPDRALLADLALLSQRAGVRPPQLFTLPDLATPVALDRARIVLPDWAPATLDRAQLNAMLAHELGHVVRGDPWRKQAIALWRALAWFLPFAGTAQRRLDELAELACDAFAAQHTGDRHSLAECLVACGERHAQPSVLPFAPAMAARPSALIDRVERLLEGGDMQIYRHALRLRAIAAGVLATAAVCLPAVGIDAAHAASGLAPVAAATTVAAVAPSAANDPAGSKHTSSHFTVSGETNGRDRTVISQGDDTHKFSADIDGKMELAPDETDVAGLEANGSATFEQWQNGTRRRIEIASRAGKLERRFFVDGTEQPYDDKAQAFMRDVVLELARAGVGAEARAARLYREGGAARVLAEIDAIPSDYVKGVYLKVLVAKAKLAPAELERAIAAAGGMGSDYERRQSLSAIFDTQTLDAARQLQFLHQTPKFTSDYELAELLLGMLPKLAAGDDVHQAWLDAGLRIGGDYERRRSLTAFVDRTPLDDAQLARVIASADRMHSDYEERELLTDVARHAHDIDALAPAYAKATERLGSDYERREALVALVRSGKLGTRASDAVLDAAGAIGSSYECREVLVELGRVMPQDAQLVKHYRQIAQRLSGDDRQQAEAVITL